MDLASRCKDKLAYFRIKELKDVLTQLGLAKQGKKQDLVDRILSVLSDEQLSKVHGYSKKNPIRKEEIAKIIDDTYRKMQIHGTSDLASKGQSGSDNNNRKHIEEHDDSLQLDMKVRCPCGSSLLTESMIKCEDPRCRVWQHIGCVIIPEKPMEGILPVPPPQFYCEVCRLSRADPFWVTVAHPLLPTKSIVSDFQLDGSNPMQNVEKTFQLTRADRDMLQKTEYDVQVWCILLNDKVPFRMQWPLQAELQVNGVQVRTTNRPGPQMLGINGRDDGPVISTCTREGINKISLSGCDARIFCLGVRIGRRRTIQQVLNMIPKEPDGERLEDAVARVCRCIGGGNATENADSDSDLEVVAESVTVNLRCPLSGSRMKIAGRFKPCAHMGCFDLETFVELNQRSRKWQCPICLKNYSLENLIVDPYFNCITTMMRQCGEDVNEIDVKPDGCWRARNEREQEDLLQWHLPDGAVSIAMIEQEELKPDVETTKHIKQEGISEGHSNLELSVKKNGNGMWQVNKPDDMCSLSSGSRLVEQYGNHCLKTIPMSSSATGSSREGEDPSVNQDGGGHFDFSMNNGNELDSLSHKIVLTGGVGNRPPAVPPGNPDVIVLSDSDEDDVVPPVMYDTSQTDAGNFPFIVPPVGIHTSYPEDPDQGLSRNSCPGLFNGNTADFGLPPWSLPSVTQTSSSLRLFGTDSDVSNSLVGVHRSVACSTSMNGFVLAPGENLPVPDLNADLVDNRLPYGGEDPSLKLFLPSKPVGPTERLDLRDQPDMSNGFRTEDWISLSIGGRDGRSGSGHGEFAATNGVNSRPLITSKKSGLESLADAATLHPSVHADDNSGRMPMKRHFSDGWAFSVPRQPRSVPRSVRPRYFSVDSGSE